MEPRLFDAHCHLDLMAHPDAVADEATALGLGLFDCGVDPRDFSAANERAHRQPSIIAGIGLHPGGLPTVAAVLPKSICFAKLQPKSATSARWDSTFLRALPEASRCKHRHLTGSARLSRNILLPGV